MERARILFSGKKAVLKKKTTHLQEDAWIFFNFYHVWCFSTHVLSTYVENYATLKFGKLNCHGLSHLRSHGFIFLSAILIWYCSILLLTRGERSESELEKRPAIGLCLKFSKGSPNCHYVFHVKAITGINRSDFFLTEVTLWRLECLLMDRSEIFSTREKTEVSFWLIFLPRSVFFQSKKC